MFEVPAFRKAPGIDSGAPMRDVFVCMRRGGGGGGGDRAGAARKEAARGLHRPFSSGSMLCILTTPAALSSVTISRSWNRAVTHFAFSSLDRE